MIGLRNQGTDKHNPHFMVKFLHVWWFVHYRVWINTIYFSKNKWYDYLNNFLNPFSNILLSLNQSSPKHRRSINTTFKQKYLTLRYSNWFAQTQR